MLRRLWLDESGAALVEFAFTLPLLLLLYISGYVVSDMIACNRKVTIAARALTDLATRNLSPTLTQANAATASASSYLGAAAIVMTPYNMAVTTQKLSLLRICDATHAYAVWSQTQTQDAAGNILTSPIVAGQPNSSFVVLIPSTMLPSGSTLIPVNPNGTTGICSIFSASSASLTQIGQAGGYLFVGTIIYQSTPAISLGAKSTTTMQDAIYMSPRLN